MFQIYLSHVPLFIYHIFIYAAVRIENIIYIYVPASNDVNGTAFYRLLCVVKIRKNKFINIKKRENLSNKIIL